MKLLALIPFLAVVFAQDTSLAGVKEAFVNANIPNTLKINFDPKFLLEVALPQSTGLPVLVHTGIQLPRNDTAIQPIFTLIDPSDPARAPVPGPLVVACVDPDAPTPASPTNAQVRHFLGGDYAPKIIGHLTTPLLANSTAAISNWQQPTPGGGNHRYVFLVFHQPAGFDQQTLITPATPIQHFDIAQFGEAVGLGDPIAGTFMMVANPDNP